MFVTDPYITCRDRRRPDERETEISVGFDCLQKDAGVGTVVYCLITVKAVRINRW